MAERALEHLTTMFILRALMTRFDDALEWPEDPLLGDEEPIDSWSRGLVEPADG